MAKDKVVFPQEAGYYWARESGFKWWNMLVYVYGDAPFFKIKVWWQDSRNEAGDCDIDRVAEFGPLIAKDIPDIAGKREDWK